jgi:hypothetical protein
MAVLRNIPVQQRGPGVVVSPSVTVDVDATGYLRVIADIPATDYADTQNSMTLRLYQLHPTSQSWVVIAGTNWVGGDRTDRELGVNPMPYVTLDSSVQEPRDSTRSRSPGTHESRGADRCESYLAD